MTRFLVARAVPEATSANTVSFFEQEVAGKCGWPRAVYHDNGSHFKKHFTGKVDAIFLRIITWVAQIILSCDYHDMRDNQPSISFLPTGPGFDGLQMSELCSRVRTEMESRGMMGGEKLIKDIRQYINKDNEAPDRWLQSTALSTSNDAAESA